MHLYSLLSTFGSGVHGSICLLEFVPYWWHLSYVVAVHTDEGPSDITIFKDHSGPAGYSEASSQ